MNECLGEILEETSKEFVAPILKNKKNPWVNTLGIPEIVLVEILTRIFDDIPEEQLVRSLKRKLEKFFFFLEKKILEESLKKSIDKFLSRISDEILGKNSEDIFEGTYWWIFRKCRKEIVGKVAE